MDGENCELTEADDVVIGAGRNKSDRLEEGVVLDL